MVHCGLAAIPFSPFGFFLKRIGRRAVRNIKKKGVRRATTKESALYRARAQFFTKRRKPAGQKGRNKNKQTPAKLSQERSQVLGARRHRVTRLVLNP